MSSKMFDMSNVFCITTEAGKKIVAIDAQVDSKTNVLYQLCQCIVELEAQGSLISGVVELCPDGTRPRVKFRKTKEYSAAKRALRTEQALSGKYAKLAKDLKAAHEYGLAHMGADDGGTCNFDSPTLCLPRWNKEKVEAAVKEAGLRCFEWRPFGGTKFWVISVPGTGQGYTRTNAAEAMKEYLGNAGYHAGMYYQAD